MAIRWAELIEHVVLFAILVTCSTVVYHGLRREKVGEIIKVGLTRSVFFVGMSLFVFGGLGLILANWL